MKGSGLIYSVQTMNVEVFFSSKDFNSLSIASAHGFILKVSEKVLGIRLSLVVALRQGGL